MAALNAMGMKLQDAFTDRAVEDKDTLTRSIRINTSHITVEKMLHARPLPLDICDYYLKTSGQGGMNVELLLKLTEQDKVEDHMNVISFYATMHNQEIKEKQGFTQPQILMECINELIKADHTSTLEDSKERFSDVKKRMDVKVNEYQQYQQFTQDYKVFRVDQPSKLHEMSIQEYKTHLKATLLTHAE